MQKIMIFLCLWQATLAMESSPKTMDETFYKNTSTMHNDTPSIIQDPSAAPMPQDGFEWLKNTLHHAYKDPKGPLGHQFQEIDILIMLQESPMKALVFLAKNTCPAISPLCMEKLGISGQNTNQHNFSSLKAIYRKPHYTFAYK